MSENITNKEKQEHCKTCWNNWQNKEWCGYVQDCIYRPLVNHYVPKEKMEWVDKIARWGKHKPKDSK